MSFNQEAELQQRVILAKEKKQPVCIVGKGSKSFYGREAVGEPMSIEQHTGVVDYEPTELVITVRAGTRISEINEVLEKNNQMLGFEPPDFDNQSTIGGTVASGFAGSARPFNGAVKDFVLGIKCLTGEGRVLKFGGKVMKNVAGFDVSRLMVGALGCLGVLLEITFRVIPKPQCERTLVFQHTDANNAIDFINKIAGKPIPISAASWYDGLTRIRLSGSELGVLSMVKTIGGDLDERGGDFWESANQQTHPFFNAQNDVILANGSVAPATPYIPTQEVQFIDWGGARRWIYLSGMTHGFCHDVRRAGGHVIQFRGGDRRHEVFDQLPEPMMKIHQNLKQSFDPMGILNPGRMYKML